jgi:enoyl-CoA hydratase
MSASLLSQSVEGRVGVIELARPEKFNCLSMAAFRELESALDAFEADPAVRAVLLCAQGKNFCTGAELDEVRAIRDDAAKLRVFLELGHSVLNRIEDSRLPVVAAVQGLCLAGGLELMMACDVAFAASTARFGDQHGQFGLVPGWGGSQRLPRIVGERRALELFLGVTWIDAARAESFGLVNRVVDDDLLRRETMAYCAQLAERSAPGMALMKRLARIAGRDAMRAGLRAEIEAVIAPLMSADVSEGLAAFQARRKPNFD